MGRLIRSQTDENAPCRSGEPGGAARPGLGLSTQLCWHSRQDHARLCVPRTADVCSSPGICPLGARDTLQVMAARNASRRAQGPPRWEAPVGGTRVLLLQGVASVGAGPGGATWTHSAGMAAAPHSEKPWKAIRLCLPPAHKAQR